MICLQGKGVSEGLAQGPICFYRRAEAAAFAGAGSAAAADPAAEARRFARAAAKTAEHLNALAETARAAAGEEAALLFEAHALLAKDEDFADFVNAAIESEHCSAERAVQLARERFAALLAAADDAYLQQRADDVRNVARQILNSLTGVSEGGIVLRKPAILAADDFTPSETLLLDKTRLLGLLTQSGSASSHTAILARTMGIPAICGLGEALGPALDGRMAVMDGAAGTVAVEPDAAALTAFAAACAQRQTLHAQAEAARGQPDVTLDGRVLHVYCNIGAPEDLAAVQANDGQGVGLFRSEFLYLAAGGCPTEEQQFQAYRAIAAAMEGRRVVIRTLDVGSDKQLSHFDLPREENPALGMRGVRVCLAHPEVFCTQLRALYRASAYGNVAILLPMIASVWEVRECKRLCQSVIAQLEREGALYRADTALGVMIETPAAVLIAAELAREADFFSVGTNDLTQYLLACDRQSGHLEKFRDTHHPAVLRAVKLAADAARAAGIPISICGDLAADLSLTQAFAAMGIDALSVPPAAVLPLRAAVRRTSAKGCAPQAPQ